MSKESPKTPKTTRRVNRVHVVQQSLDQQQVIDRAESLGALRVLGPHLVAGAIGVGNVGGQHRGLQSRFTRLQSKPGASVGRRAHGCLDLKQFNVKSASSPC